MIRKDSLDSSEKILAFKIEQKVKSQKLEMSKFEFAQVTES